MEKNLEIYIKYNSDSISRNNLFEFLIDFLMNNNELAGGFNLRDEREKGFRND